MNQNGYWSSCKHQNMVQYCDMSTPNKWEQLHGEQLLTELQSMSIQENISDIHTSPEKKYVRLEIRRHGMLELIGKIEHRVYEDYVRRVKFESKLKLNIVNIPQDGQYTFEAPNRIVNVRVATLPSRFGEKLTLRLLDPVRGIVPLEELGFPKEIYEEMRRVAHMPHGLFLITGPTGSGKTTTLYALLSTLVGKSRNIITLEDPIEYELQGIVQSQVDHAHDYNFATGLRAILRHDPDVVLVGEIRDLETAQTAVDASLTGHIVLSTLHTNSAVEAIPRLLSMGVSPYTFAPALRAILAQRLVRTLTENCRKPETQCDPADNASYDGRMAIPELLVIDEKLREMILLNETADAITKYAKEHGYRTMQEWGKLLVSARMTTQSEVERVTAV